MVIRSYSALRLRRGVKISLGRWAVFPPKLQKGPKPSRSLTKPSRSRAHPPLAPAPATCVPTWPQPWLGGSRQHPLPRPRRGRGADGAHLRLPRVAYRGARHVGCCVRRVGSVGAHPEPNLRRGWLPLALVLHGMIAPCIDRGHGLDPQANTYDGRPGVRGANDRSVRGDRES